MAESGVVKGSGEEEALQRATPGGRASGTGTRASVQPVSARESARAPQSEPAPRVCNPGRAAEGTVTAAGRAQEGWWSRPCLPAS